MFSRSLPGGRAPLLLEGLVSFVALFAQMAVLFLPVAMGYVAARLGFMDDAFDNRLSRLGLNVALLVLVLLRGDDLGVLGDGLKVAGSLTTPAVLLITGASLANYEPLSMLTSWRAYAVAAVRLLLVPVVLLALFGLLTADGFVRAIIVVGSAMLVATNAILFCLIYGTEPKPALQGTFVSVVAPVATIPVVAMLV